MKKLNLQDRTGLAALNAETLVDEVRSAHRESCFIHGADGPGDALELLLREAMVDAVRLRDRLQLIAKFAAGPNYI